MTLGIELVGGDGHLGEVTSTRTRCLSGDARERGHGRTRGKGEGREGRENTGDEVRGRREGNTERYRRLGEDSGGKERMR